jgi:hypothetical protein
MEEAWYRQQQLARQRTWGRPAQMWDGANPFIPGGGNTVWEQDGLLVDDAKLRWKVGLGRVDREWSDAIAATALKSTNGPAWGWTKYLPKNRGPWPV